MNKRQLRKILDILQKVSKVPKRSRRNYLRTCDSDEIHAICGATKNILEENIHIPKGKKSYLKKKLKPHKRKLKNLSNPKLSLKQKRLLLEKEQVGAGVFTAIASVAIPAIIAALA